MNKSPFQNEFFNGNKRKRIRNVLLLKKEPLRILFQKNRIPNCLQPFAVKNHFEKNSRHQEKNIPWPISALVLWYFLFLSYAAANDSASAHNSMLLSHETYRYAGMVHTRDSIPVLVSCQSPMYERKPVLRWHNVSIPVSQYVIQVSTSSDFAATLINLPVSGTSYAVPIDLPTGMIYWRVRADELQWSAVSSFKIIEGKVPLLIPHENPTYDQTPVLRWHKSKTPVTSYMVIISRDSLMHSILLDTIVTDTVLPVPILLPFGAVYWRVKGDDSEISDYSNFQILDGRIPQLIAHESPTLEQRPTLLWHRPPVSASSFTIQLSRDPLFSLIYLEKTVSDTFYTPTIYLPNGMIYWRVRGDDSPWSAASSFEIKDNRIPLLVPYTPKVTNTVLPELKWKRVETAKEYIIEIDDNSDFSSTIVSIPVTDTAFIPLQPLPVDTIYWRVKSDLIEVWSDIDSFWIQSDTVPLLELFDGTVVGLRPLFRWHPVAGNNIVYRFMLSDDKSFTDAVVVDLADTVYMPDANLHTGMWFWKVSCSKDSTLFSFIDSLKVDTISMITADADKTKLHPVTIKKIGARIIVQIDNIEPNTVLKGILYDIRGRLVARIDRSIHTEDSYVWDITQNNTRVASGIYIVQLKIDKRMCVRYFVVRK